MQFDVKREAAALFEKTLETRRDIHEHPELGFQEFRTAQIAEDRLRSLGIEVRRCATTGVIGVLEGGKSGKTVMLRSELDALPVTEVNDLPFCSKNPGVMHACGHDCHVAIQLGVAELLSAHRSEIPGTVVFLFQPNEEVLGAPRMIAEGALENPRPDAIFGMHVWSQIPIGKIGVVAGPDCASSYYFKATVHGRGTHGCLPERGVSPIECGRHVLDAICSMQTMEFSTLDEPTLITVGSIHSGDYMNNIPDTLVMEGSIRCLHERGSEVNDRFVEIVRAVCAAYRCTCEIELTCGNNTLVNDTALAATVKAVATERWGDGCVTDKGVREMGGDDLAEFFREGIPGCYYLVGMGNEAKGSCAAHHNRDFRVDEDVLSIGVELQSAVVLRYLGVE